MEMLMLRLGIAQVIPGTRLLQYIMTTPAAHSIRTILAIITVTILEVIQTEMELEIALIALMI